MKYLKIILFLGFTTTCFLSCKDISRGEQLAITNCGACHQMPKPNLLDKTTWKNNVLPQMAIFMGLTPLTNLSKYSMTEMDKIHKLRILPTKPLISESDFNEIVNYYVKNAPDQLELQTDQKFQTLDNIFDSEIYPFENDKEITLLKYNKTINQLNIGTRQGGFWSLKPKSGKIDSLFFFSPVTDVNYKKDRTFGIVLVGKLEPNLDANGVCLFGSSLKVNSINTLNRINFLQRPMNLEFADLNQDNIEEAIICSYGNFSGKLAWYELPVNMPPVEHIIKQVAGITNVCIKDLNNDNLLDIIALVGKNNEGVYVFYNKGMSGNSVSQFEEVQVLKFPPVYGSSHIEIEDFNNDGFVDLLISNGDNENLSQIFKPYHGVRIFLNDGKNHFSEKYFFPIYGAMKSLARDFDGDGDLDIATISFFPDYAASPQKSFVYLQNNSNKSGFKFTPFISAKTDSGRWMVMDTFDYDQDGDEDILLGACYDAVRLKKTNIPKTGILVLKNKFRK